MVLFLVALGVGIVNALVIAWLQYTAEHWAAHQTKGR